MAFVFACAPPVSVHAAENAAVAARISVTVEFGPDRGNNPGSLFEIVNAEGRVVGGAGFLGAYNTQPRSDRELLQVFLRGPAGKPEWNVEPMPPVESPARGFYPFSAAGKLYLLARGGLDSRIRRWDESQRQWVVDDSVRPYAEHVAGKRLEVTSEEVTYDGRTLFNVNRPADKPPTPLRIGEHYFANGQLFLRLYSPTADPRVSQLVVYSWQPEGSDGLIEMPDARADLTINHEFIYTFGQWHDHVVAVSNNGRVLRFDGQRWSVLRAPVPNVSYQIYAGVNYYDRLLLGHYPTGEIYEYAGGDLKLLKGWPPRMAGVSGSAREAQTLAIYGGDLYCGVWPWGEVWRYNRNGSAWELAQRMFKHPAPTDKFNHPYEAETKAVDPVANLWGQRITGLVPVGRDLIVTTSSKGGNPWDPKFAFLSPEQQAEFGATYRVTVPGNLAVSMRWKPGPTRFDIAIANETLTVLQDGESLGTLPIDEGRIRALHRARVVFGQGVFGPLRGKILDKSPAQTSVPAAAERPGHLQLRATGIPRPFLGAYFHPDRFFTPTSTEIEQRKTWQENLDRMQVSGLNVIMPYFTGSSGQAYYDSRILPQKVYSVSDPMAQLMREARARGLQVYPVVCVAVCGNEKPAGILLERPEWGLRHPDGQPLGYISPAHPDARAWIVSSLREIISRYHPEGIVLDYIRFHNRPLRLDVAAEKRFRDSLPAGISTAEEQQRLQAFKEDAVADLVREISQAVHEEQPGIQLAAYVWGPHTREKHLTAQVWPRWLDSGQLDLVNVSGYYHHDKYGDKYLPLFEQRMTEALALSRQSAHPAPVTFALGVNTSHGRVHSADDIRVYLNAAARARLDGVALFTWQDTLPYLDELNQTDEFRKFSAQAANSN